MVMVVQMLYCERELQSIKQSNVNHITTLAVRVVPAIHIDKLITNKYHLLDLYIYNYQKHFESDDI